MPTKNLKERIKRVIKEIKEKKQREADLELLFEGVSIQFEPGVNLTEGGKRQILDFVINPAEFAKKGEPIGGEDDWPENRDRIL